MALKELAAHQRSWWNWRHCYSSASTRSLYQHGARFDSELLPRQQLWQMQRASMANARTKKNMERRASRNTVQSFDNLIQAQKPLKRLLIVKNFLARHPKQAMLVSELGRRLEVAGMMKSRSLNRFLKKYPAMYKISENVRLKEPFVEFADTGRELLEEEENIMKWYEPHLVDKVRKLLMMSVDRRLQVDHLCLLQEELALPYNFEKKFIHEYPQFFRVVEDEDGLFLELTAWDDSLAITAREQSLAQNPLFDKHHRPLPHGFPIHLPKGHRLGIKDTEAMNKWQRAAFTSPYENSKWVDPMSFEAGKRAVAVVHEFLSLTVEKRSIADHLDIFHKNFKLPVRLPKFLQRHFGIFYVTQRGNRNSVFLKEAYRAKDHSKKLAHLVEKGPLVLLNELFEKVMDIDSLKKPYGLVENDEESIGSESD